MAALRGALPLLIRRSYLAIAISETSHGHMSLEGVGVGDSFGLEGEEMERGCRHVMAVGGQEGGSEVSG